MEKLKVYLNHVNTKLRKQTALIISNIACGNINDLKILINSGFYELLIKCYYSETEYIVKKEIAHALVNMTNRNYTEIKLYMIDNNICDVLVNILDSCKKGMLLLGLEGLRNLLSIDDLNAFYKIISSLEIMGVYDRLESLQESEDEEIYQYVFSLMSEYFNITLI